MASYTTNFLWDHPKPGDNLYDYSGGMINTPDTPVTLDQTKNQLPVIDTSNPQLMTAGFSWPFRSTNEYATTRPRGIDTPMNYQDQIRSFPGGNYQGWQDLIMDPVRQENLAESNFNQALESGAYDDEGTGRAEINYEDAPVGFSKFLTGDRRLHPNNPLLKLTQGLGSIFQPNEQMEAAISDIRDTGEFQGQRYNIDEDRNKIYSEVNPFGKNLRSWKGSDDPTAMDDKTLAWAMDRLSKGKAISTRLRNILQNRGMLTPTGLDRPGQRVDDLVSVTDVVPHDTRTVGGYEGPPTVSFNPQQFARAGRRADRPGGFTDPGAGSYGPWKAEGGRIGYRNGEFVDEDVNIQGPGYDVNENIEMASAQDPMDALNDMAMQIFGKQLHELTPEEKQILFDMANDQAAGQGEGIASLV